jgi:ribose transport system ATP-binding protein
MAGKWLGSTAGRPKLDVGSSDFALETMALSKRYPGVQALDKASIRVKQGSIHGIIGENGAGKSTLVDIVAGVTKADSGTVYVMGREVGRGGVHEVLSAGVKVVAQNPRLAPDLTICQNLFLGEGHSKRALVESKSLRSRAETALADLGIQFDPRERVSRLTTRERGLVAIGLAGLDAPRLLILDEPTALLGADEVDRLFGYLKRLNQEGTTIVFVSHRLWEVRELVSEVSVLRDGSHIGTVARSEVSEAELIEMMLGRRVEQLIPERRSKIGEAVLRVTNLSAGRGRDAVDKISFQVARGEVLGIAGVQGNGQRTLLRSLYGLDRVIEGSIEVNGRRYRGKAPSAAVRAGILYISHDRGAEGIFPQLTVRENVSAPNLRAWSRLAVVAPRQEIVHTADVMNSVGIRLSAIEGTASGLSGGNQQKLVIGRWLSHEPALLLLDEPTQGVDVGAKAEIYQLVQELTDAGTAVLLLTSDVNETLGLCDRAIVLSRGQIKAEFDRDALTEEHLLTASVGEQTGHLSKTKTESASPTGFVRGRGEGLSLKLREWSIPAVLVAILTILGIVTQTINSSFLSVLNIESLLALAAPLLLVTVGETVVMASGGIDLSVGPMMTLTTVVLSYIASSSGGSEVAACMLVLLLGMTVGALNGLLVWLCKIPDLIATLGTYIALEGLALLIRTAPGGSVGAGIMTFASPQAGIPVAFWVALIAAGTVGLVFRKFSVGLNLLATGSSKQAARAVGLSAERQRFGSYIVSGLFAAAAGIALAGIIGSGDPTAGNVYTLSAITAAVVGGVSLLGGRANLAGVVLGSLLVAAISNFLDLLAISSYWDEVWTGLIIIAAVAIYARGDGVVGARSTRFRWHRRKMVHIV